MFEKYRIVVLQVEVYFSKIDSILFIRGNKSVESSDSDAEGFDSSLFAKLRPTITSALFLSPIASSSVLRKLAASIS